MNLNRIMAELENYELEVSEIKQSAGALQAALTYYIEQVESRKTWTREDLALLRDTSQVNKALMMLEAALRTAEKTDNI
jgi:hypothetical protein